MSVGILDQSSGACSGRDRAHRTSELYDPERQIFVAAGGVGLGWRFLRSAEILDPADRKFRPTVGNGARVITRLNQVRSFGELIGVPAHDVQREEGLADEYGRREGDATDASDRQTCDHGCRRAIPASGDAAEQSGEREHRNRDVETHQRVAEEPSPPQKNRGYVGRGDIVELGV